MEKFMLLIREDLKRMRASTEEERVAEMLEMFEWTKSIAASGNYVTSEPLGVTGRYVSKKAVLSDGPFIESKEGIAGYYIIQVNNINEAVSIAQNCPLVMRDAAIVEVRPIEKAIDLRPQANNAS
jgi:hypothetical protein